MSGAPPPKVAERFDFLEPAIKARLLTARAMIFHEAQSLPEVGAIEETLKWNQPSYLTSETGAGTTIRLSTSKDDVPALYLHCQTTIISEFQSQFPQELSFDTNRGVHLTDDTPDDLIRLVIRRALTYHL